jgi:hypothetical protein
MHEIRRTFIKGEEIGGKCRTHINKTIGHETVVCSTIGYETVVCSTVTHRLTKGLSFAELYGARIL